MLRKIISKIKNSVNGNGTSPKAKPKTKPAPAPASRAAGNTTEWKPGQSPKLAPTEKPRTPASPAAPRTRAPSSSNADRPPRADGRPPRRRRRRASGDAKEGSKPASSRSARSPLPPRNVRPLPPVAPKAKIPTFEGQLKYADMDLPDEIKRAMVDMEFEHTTPIQTQLLPLALEGKDAAGRAQTGTGKTAAFLIAIFTRFLRNPIQGDRPKGTPRALVLAPTRELAIQIYHDAMEIGSHMKHRTVAVYGGMDFDKQQHELDGDVDIIVATPGRLLDFVQRHVIDLSKVEVLVIDEADRMLDMGFIPDVRRIVRATPRPERRQTLFFSATLTPEILRLSAQWTHDAVIIEIEPDHVAADSVNQLVYITTMNGKFTLLYNLLKRENPDRVIVFSNRRDQAEQLHLHLSSYGFPSALLSGAVDQKKRLRVLDDFKSGKVQVLVATDVAGRGLHVQGISHVINYHMPMDPDDYVHRIGRTGRAGDTGTSISFACELDSFAIPDVEKFLGTSLDCKQPEEELLTPLPAPLYKVERAAKPEPRRNTGRSPGGRSGPGRGRGGPPRRGAPRR